MSTVVGQTITDIITIRDDVHDGILGLLEDDFETLEAFSVTTPASTVPVALDELDDGQYVVSFAPTLQGKWALHFKYEDVGVAFSEDTILYDIATSSEITVVVAGGTWTYSGDLTDPIQEVRFLIQDTDGGFPLFVDTEIAYALGAVQNNSRRAAASLVERLMARYAQMADTTELDLSVRASQLYEHAKDLLTSLNNPFSAAATVKPYAGGISNNDIAVGYANPDRTTAIFDRQATFRQDAWGGIRH